MGRPHQITDMLAQLIMDTWPSEIQLDVITDTGKCYHVGHIHTSVERVRSDMMRQYGCKCTFWHRMESVPNEQD